MAVDLLTDYMGLELRNPLVASPSPLSYTLDGVKRLADGGVGAIVLFSLFEEQLREEAARTIRLVEETAESFPEALDYFPSVVEEDGGPRAYLDLLERAASAVDAPVIASLNGVTPEGWTDYARAMEEAGAAAIELNIYYLPGDLRVSGREVEQRHVDVLERVKSAVSVPVAVKLTPYFSSAGEMALRLDEAGADGLVLFNRFLQPDIDPEQLAVLPRVNLSSPADARLARTWIALLRGRVRASLAATSGVEVPADVARYLLAGADVVMTTSALLRHGPNYAADLLDGVTAWMSRKGFDDLARVRGLLAVPSEADAAAYERAGYVTCHASRQRRGVRPLVAVKRPRSLPRGGVARAALRSAWLDVAERDRSDAGLTHPPTGEAIVGTCPWVQVLASLARGPQARTNAAQQCDPSIARAVLERNAQSDAESRHGTVFHREVLSEHFGDSQVAHRSRRRVHRVASGSLPGLTAYTDNLGNAVHAVCHAVLLIVVAGAEWTLPGGHLPDQERERSPCGDRLGLVWTA